MGVELNHLIVPATSKRASAEFLAGVLGVEVGPPWGPFVPVQVAGVTVDYEDATHIHPMHLAFLVSDEAFDAALGRLLGRGVATYADPFRRMAGRINHLYGGRGVYFDDPDCHLWELITAPYGPVAEVEAPDPP
jgi:catechol 2,3-dioxygenase-like lactoylglutathione lyase family enzyme